MNGIGPLIRRPVRWVGRRVRSTRKIDGVPIPPPELRYCGDFMRDDDVFLQSGRDEARRLVDDYSIGSNSRIVEIGCGPGRLPLGLIAAGVQVEHYDGIDIDEKAVAWCTRHISCDHSSFEFHHIDAHHDRYNPDGTPMGNDFMLDLRADSYDLVYLHSVFANMLADDVRVYCREFFRLLKPGGSVFLTAFVEDGVPPITVNPVDYHIQSSGALNLSRYERSYFLLLVAESGLELVSFEHASELGGQSSVHMRRPPIGSAG